ncbi:MAG: hypothetical protein ACI85O_002644 [Saprospiraceae bacterium]
MNGLFFGWYETWGCHCAACEDVFVHCAGLGALGVVDFELEGRGEMDALLATIESCIDSAAGRWLCFCLFWYDLFCCMKNALLANF